MLEYAHREPDGRLLLGHNLLTDEKVYLALPRGCELRPATDDTLRLSLAVFGTEATTGTLHEVATRALEPPPEKLIPPEIPKLPSIGPGAWGDGG